MNIDEALLEYEKSLSYQVDKGFYMSATEYLDWVELFCGKPEEDDTGETFIDFENNPRRRAL